MTSNSFHQQFARQTSSVALTSDLIEAWYPGLRNMCHWVLGSFSGNPRDLHTGHTRSKPITALENKSWQVKYNFYTIRGFLWNQQLLETETYCWNSFTLTVNLRCTFKYVHHQSYVLPVSVTHPSSRMTCGLGFSVFITSSSDNRSLLSDSGAKAKNKRKNISDTSVAIHWYDHCFIFISFWIMFQLL